MARHREASCRSATRRVKFQISTVRLHRRASRVRLRHQVRRGAQRRPTPPYSVARLASPSNFPWSVSTSFAPSRASTEYASHQISRGGGQKYVDECELRESGPTPTPNTSRRHKRRSRHPIRRVAQRRSRHPIRRVAQRRSRHPIRRVVIGEDPDTPNTSRRRKRSVVQLCHVAPISHGPCPPDVDEWDRASVVRTPDIHASHQIPNSQRSVSTSSSTLVKNLRSRQHMSVQPTCVELWTLS